MGGEIFGRIAMIIHGAHVTPFDPACERRTGFDGEAVEGQMIGCKLQCVIQIPRPVAAERGRKAEDEVQRQIVEPGLARPEDCAGHRRRIVGAVHPAKHTIIERLGPEREPGYPSRAPGRRRSRRYVLRIRFERDLRVGGDRAFVGDHRNQPGHVLRRKTGRRAATKIDGLHQG